MKNLHKQTGSAHVVIIVILIVVILGLLGFVFWQNSMKKSGTQTATGTSTTVSTTKAATVALKDGQVDSHYPTPLSWKYPASWTQTVSGTAPTGSADETASQTYTITSPSGDYSAHYTVGVGGGIGGTCGPEDAAIVDSIQEKSISGFSKGLFVQYIGRNYDSSSDDGTKPFLGYNYVSSIYENTADIAAAKAGTSRCVFGLGAITLGVATNYTLLGASVSIKSLDDVKDANGNTALSKDTTAIQSAFASSEYKDAVNILLSTKFGQ